MGDEKPEPPSKDVVFVHSPTPEGDGYRVLRAREERVEVGEIRPMKEGRPLSGELVKLKAREGEERMFDVEVLHDARPAESRSAGKPGPAQVATEAYRAGWDAIFGDGDASRDLN
jgi:hypothetical protein